MTVWSIRRLLPPVLIVGASFYFTFTHELNAQTATSGALAGVITDQTDAVIPDVTVEIRDNAKSTTQYTKTDRAAPAISPFSACRAPRICSR